MSTDTSTTLETALDPSASALAIASESLSVAGRTPVIFGAYLLVAIVTLLSDSLGGIVGLAAGAYAVVAAYRTFGGRAQGQVRFGINLIIVFISSLIAGVAVFVGLLLLVVPGLYLIARLRLATAAIMLEDRGPIEALGRSYNLTEGHTTTVFGVLILFAGLQVVVLGGVGLLMGAFAGGTVNVDALEGVTRIGSAITAVLISPVDQASNAIMYGLYNRNDTPRS